MKISIQTHPPKKEFTMNIQSLIKAVTVLLSLCLIVSCVGTNKKTAQQEEAAQAPTVEKLASIHHKARTCQRLSSSCQDGTTKHDDCFTTGEML